MAAPGFNTGCMFSSVRNVSGSIMNFGFLPPHGRELDINEEYTIFGNIYDAVAHANGGDRTMSRRWIQAFEDAIEDGDIIVVTTPNPILQDTATGAVKMLELTSGSVVVAAPCWTTPGSVIDDHGGEDFTGGLT